MAMKPPPPLPPWSPHLDDVLLAGGVRDSLVKQEESFPIGNQAPILHSSSGEVRNGRHVGLGQRIIDAEELLVKLQNFCAVFCRQIGLTFLAFLPPDRPDLSCFSGARFCRLKRFLMDVLLLNFCASDLYCKCP